MTFLLDVNVLLALLDPEHENYQACRYWFNSRGTHGWATCPITENAAIRILSNPIYRNSPGGAEIVLEMLRDLQTLPGHTFWPDDFSLTALDRIDAGYLFTPNQITDIYLLLLAQSHGGKLATFDRRIPAASVLDGENALHVIGGEQ